MPLWHSISACHVLYCMILLYVYSYYSAINDIIRCFSRSNFLFVLFWSVPLYSQAISHRQEHTVPLDMKGCICHLAKWQIHPFISKGTIYYADFIFLLPPWVWYKPYSLRWFNKTTKRLVLIKSTIVVDVMPSITLSRERTINSGHVSLYVALGHIHSITWFGSYLFLDKRGGYLTE